MIDYVKISDYENNLVYILNLESRITIITGDSATGKSTLIRYIENYNKDSYNSIKIESEKKLIHLTPVMVRNKFELSEDAIYFMDEGDNVKSKEYFTLVNDTRYKFVIITRDVSYPSIPYDIEDIYEIKYNNGANKLVKIYKDNYRTDKLDVNINKIFTEDEKSGYEFYKELSNYSVFSTKGASRIPYKIKKNNNSIFIVDSLGFGPYINRTLLNLKSSNSIFIAPKSFEYLILMSLFSYSEEDLKHKLESYRESYHLINKFNINDENIYYQMLIDECFGLGIDYNKSYLPDYFIEEENFDKVLDSIDKRYRLLLKSVDNNLIDDIFSWE